MGAEAKPRKLWRVLRPFLCEGRQLMHGELVDASGWRTVAMLEDTGAIRAFEGEPVEAMGRLWDHESTALLAEGLLAEPDPEPQATQGDRADQAAITEGLVEWLGAGVDPLAPPPKPELEEAATPRVRGGRKA